MGFSFKDVDWEAVWAKAKKIFIDQFLLISYFIATLIALTWPTPGEWVVGLEVTIAGRTYQIVKTINIMVRRSQWASWLASSLGCREQPACAARAPGAAPGLIALIACLLSLSPPVHRRSSSSSPVSCSRRTT